MENVRFSSVSVRVAVLAVLAVVAPSSIALASDTTPIFWMAASAPDASFSGPSWGRLSLADGELRFRSSAYAWRVALSEVKRVDQSKAAPRALEVETASGAIYFIAILDAKMVTDSPRKAIQMIQRGMREASGMSRPTLVAKGSR